jgi:hypothetical protein
MIIVSFVLAPWSPSLDSILWYAARSNYYWPGGACFEYILIWTSWLTLELTYLGGTGMGESGNSASCIPPVIWPNHVSLTQKKPWSVSKVLFLWVCVLHVDIRCADFPLQTRPHRIDISVASFCCTLVLLVQELKFTSPAAFKPLVYLLRSSF